MDKKPFEPAWPEKTVAVLFAIELALILMVGITSPGALSPGWIMAFFGIVSRICGFTCLPLWLVLRVIDLISGGPQRRDGGITVYPLR